MLVGLGGQKRSGKSSKDRSQKSDPKYKIFTPQEEELVIQLHAAIGSRLGSIYSVSFTLLWLLCFFTLFRLMFSIGEDGL